MDCAKLTPAIIDKSTSKVLLSRCLSQCPSHFYFSTQSKQNNGEGERLYQEALEALEQVQKLREEREKQKSEELHRAIEKAEAKEKEHVNNPKAKNLRGVTVVKTVVKQTRKERKISMKSQQEEWEKKAHELLTQAAVTHNHPQALILLGNGTLQTSHKIGWETKETEAECEHLVKQALEYYEKAGLCGASEGWFNLGQLLWTGYPATDEIEEDGLAALTDKIILTPDIEKSMNAFRKAIDLGDSDAMYFVGVHQLGSEGEETTTIGILKEGLELIESAAKLGHGPACYYRAVFHLNGNESLQIPPCSPEEFVRYLDDAVEAGDADAMFLRGTSYHEGENGYSMDFNKALRDFLAATEAGNADAAVSAGAMLHSGRPGVPQDQARAFDLYQQAGEMGSVQGWRNVVACYATGEGVPKSEATAKYIAKTMLGE